MAELNKKRILEIREKFLEKDTEGGMYLAKRYTGELLNGVPEISRATQAIIKGKVEDIDKLRELLVEYEKSIMREILEAVSKMGEE